MDTTAYNITYWYNDALYTAEVRPCCDKDNVIDFAIWQDNKLAFTITKHRTQNAEWVVSLKNADEDLEDAMIKSIGAEIDNHKKAIGE